MDIHSLRFVSDAGDTELFQSVESTLVGCLGQEGAEWGRSYGRPVRTVQVSASFVPFGKESLGVDPKLRRPLIETPVLHTFWTQCSDVETYKNTVRDDIDAWMKVLLEANISDWMIVLVETYDFRKTNKLLPRTTVLDKIRSDFGAKHADRCLSVINPLRSESRSAGSWRGLMVNFRLLLLTAYDRTLLRFEEFVREQRERRNQPGWSFTKYFLLQEELAFVLEMLGVYEEALIQYDELDALFTQFVLNSHLGESPSWLSQFCKPLESWSGLTLSDSGINVVERNRIRNDTVSLLQFRNYLFSRQCAMLLCAKKPWEVAERTLPFLHNCLRELTLLEVSAPPGTVSCWVYLSCLEVLLTCETYTERSLVEQYSIYTAGLWAYARRKLGELGELCGLMPGNAPTSEQIHLVVEISSGLDESSAATVEKLKQALSSQQAFCKQYLELSELAMGTYKHIGRMRCARSVGHDLAKFYRTIGDTQTAITFLQNALHCYEHDGWKQLSVNARLQLASSYKEIGDMHRYVKMCASIASSSELDATSRLHHFDEMVKTLKMSVQDPPWTGPLGDCLTLTDVDVRVERGSTSVSVVIGIDSLLPASVHCPAVALSIVSTTSASGQKHHGNETPSSAFRKCKEDLVPVNPFLQRLPAFSRLDYQQDKSLAGANLDIKNQKTLLKRQDSHKYRKVSNVTRSDFSRVLSASDVTLKPGRNIVTLSSKVYFKLIHSKKVCEVSLRIKLINDLAGVEYVVLFRKDDPL
ncbi:hypothetical protein AAG570_011446 [Ranatra chinensis]|uniref:TRAPPC10/Trs130 N-terminal domain-containing protein n=1 Tax=Ranatra chinensis TaxID=642074 RepID=A0ABD0YKP8_9HEMI